MSCSVPLPRGCVPLTLLSLLSPQTRAARVRAGKGDKMVTYEQAHAPHYIGHRKGWLSLHTGG